MKDFKDFYREFSLEIQRLLKSDINLTQDENGTFFYNFKGVLTPIYNLQDLNVMFQDISTSEVYPLFFYIDFDHKNEIRLHISLRDVLVKNHDGYVFSNKIKINSEIYQKLKDLDLITYFEKMIVFNRFVPSYRRTINSEQEFKDFYNFLLSFLNNFLNPIELNEIQKFEKWQKSTSR